MKNNEKETIILGSNILLHPRSWGNTPRDAHGGDGSRRMGRIKLYYISERLTPSWIILRISDDISHFIPLTIVKYHSGRESGSTGLKTCLKQG
jgi:hypothetical protein